MAPKRTSNMIDKAKLTGTVTASSRNTPLTPKKKKISPLKKAAFKKYESEALVRELLDQQFNDGQTVRAHKQAIIDIIGIQNYRKHKFIAQKLRDMAMGRSGQRAIKSEETNNLVKGQRKNYSKLYLNGTVNGQSGQRVRPYSFKLYQEPAFTKEPIFKSFKRFENHIEQLKYEQDNATDAEDVQFSAIQNLVWTKMAVDLHRLCQYYLKNQYDLTKFSLDQFQMSTWAGICIHCDQYDLNPIGQLFIEWLTPRIGTFPIEQWQNQSVNWEKNAETLRSMSSDEIIHHTDLISPRWKWENIPKPLNAIFHDTQRWDIIISLFKEYFPSKPEGLPWSIYLTQRGAAVDFDAESYNARHQEYINNVQTQAAAMYVEKFKHSNEETTTTDQSSETPKYFKRLRLLADKLQNKLTQKKNN